MILLIGVALFGLRPASAQEQIETPLPISGKQVTLQEITPADVLARVNLNQKEIELIRLELGKPQQQYPEFSVEQAAPREVFFQSLTLFRKANRLSFELTGTLAVEPMIPDRRIQPADVWNVTDSALKRILLVKQELGIPELVSEQAQDSSITPTDVYRAMVQANRQVNQLLAKKYSPSDVYQQLTLAVHYSSNLLGRFPVASTVLEEPAFARRKRPPDVYARLVECYQILRAIADTLGLKMLLLNETEQSIRGKIPSDVYDMASLLLSELDYIHKQLANSIPVKKSYYPGYKLPSHVFQRAGLLKAQLLAIQKQVELDPRRLVVQQSN